MVWVSLASMLQSGSSPIMLLYSLGKTEMNVQWWFRYSKAPLQVVEVDYVCKLHFQSYTVVCS